MSLQFFGHPFSSYTQKVLIALWADETPFEYRVIDPEHPENMEELKRHWPFGQFPLLLDNGRPFAESTPIIEHLQAEHGGIHRWIPDGDIGRKVRFLDRFFDLYIMGNMQVPVLNAIRPEGSRDSFGVEKARSQLNLAYDWLEANLGDGPWAVGEEFTLADCAAAPSLFYADWVEEIGPKRLRLGEYRARLLAHPIVTRAVDEARPYRAFFPLGAPDRD
ncbi:MAG: glutathione S-transferase family protein [Sphingomicrobium sp.]